MNPHPATATATRALGAGVLTLALTAPALSLEYDVEVLAEGLERPWGMAFVPGTADLLITGREGALMLWRADDGAMVEIAGAPEVDARGQGGLLDVAFPPDFDTTGHVWMSWVAAVPGGSTTHLGRGSFDPGAGAVTGLETVFRVAPGIDSRGHFGSRILFHDGHVFMGTGDRNFKDFGPDHIAQDLSSENGAVIRLALDGSVPSDNPFVTIPGAAPAIWSYGHRNIQAMAVRPGTDEIWLAEHGEAGGDEINLVQRAGNYGWPLASFGVNYRTGRPFAPPHREGDGFVAPVWHAPAGRTDHFPPSGMAWVTGDAFPEWEGRLLVGNLFHRYLGLFEVDGQELGSPQRLLEDRDWRIRDVAVGPDDGLIYVLTDGEGARLLRIAPQGAGG